MGINQSGHKKWKKYYYNANNPKLKDDTNKEQLSKEAEYINFFTVPNLILFI